MLKRSACSVLLQISNEVWVFLLQDALVSNGEESLLSVVEGAMEDHCTVIGLTSEPADGSGAPASQQHLTGWAPCLAIGVEWFANI
jgi:hypothetical protein